MNAVRVKSLAVGVLAAAVIGIGCGGGDDDANRSGGSTVRAPLTKAEFVKQANEACAKERAGLSHRISEFERRRAGRRPLAGADMVHFIYLPTMEAQIWRIEELGIPRGEAGRIEAMLDASESAVDAVAVVPKVPSLARAERRFVEADRLFRAYGLQACITDAGSAGAAKRG